MEHWKRRLAAAGAALVLIGTLAASGVYLASSRRMAQVYAVELRPLPTRQDAHAIQRGRHLAHAVSACAECHGSDLGGGVMIEEPGLARIAAPNLTRGRGGIGDRFAGDMGSADFERAVRHGLRRDGTSLLLMPSEAYAAMRDEDVAALLAYVRSLPPIDREVGGSSLGPLGRALLVAGLFDELSAEHVDHGRISAPPASDPLGQGRYLAEIGGCAACHTPALTGRDKATGPPGTPPPPDITRSGIGHWTETDFARALREGRRPDGRVLDPFMPWQVFRNMTDAELHALWSYLRSLPPKPGAGA